MENTISISLERLKELEALEASIPSIIENAIKEYKNSNLQKLHERDKLNPTGINMRVKRYAERHRDEINRKRREKRKNEKMVAPATNTVVYTTEEPAETTNTTETSEKSETPQRPIKIIRRSNRIQNAVDTALRTAESPIVRRIAVATEAANITGRLAEEPTPHPCHNGKQDITVRFDL